MLPCRPSGDAANAPATSMPLVLAGVLATTIPRKAWPSSARARRGQGGTRSVKQVPGGAQLHSVYTDRAILDRSGRLEALMLPRQSGGGMAGAPAAAAAAAAGNDAMLERMRKLVSDDPGRHRRGHAAAAGVRGGKMRGFRVYPGPQPPGVRRSACGRRPGHRHQRHAARRQDRAQEIFCNAELRDRRTRHRRRATAVSRNWYSISRRSPPKPSARRRPAMAYPDGQAPPEPVPGND